MLAITVRYLKTISLILIGISLNIGASALAATGIAYHGRLLLPSGEPVRASTQFRIQIRTPGNENCLMYEETTTRDLSLTDGVFSITIGDGTGSRTDSLNWSLDKIFANRSKFTFTANCNVVTDYTPNAADGRRLQVSFNDGSFAGWEDLPEQHIGYAPIALEAVQVGGFKASHLLRVQDSNGDPQNVAALTPAYFAELVALAAGTSTTYLKTGNDLSVTGKVTASQYCLGTDCITAWPTGGGGGSGTVTGIASTNGYLTVNNGSTNATLTVNVGTGANTVAAGDDSRFSDSRAPSGNAGGDLAGTYPDPTLQKIRGNAIAAGTIPAADVGKVYRWNGAALAPSYLNFGDLKTAAGTTQLPSSCAVNEKLQWSVITDTFVCEAIALNASAITAGTIDPARLPGSLTQWSNGSAGAIYYNGGFVGVGTASPLYKFHVETSTVNSASNRTVVTRTISQNTVDGTYSTIGGDLRATEAVSTGVTNSGNTIGAWVGAQRNAQAGIDDDGTLTSMYGIWAQYGHFNTNATAVPKTTNVMGLNLSPYYRTGTITNLYDLYIGSGAGGGTVTNHYSIYQTDAAAKNYLNGSVGIGVLSPTEKLEVSGKVKATGYCIGTDCITAWPSGGGGNIDASTITTGTIDPARLPANTTRWTDGASGAVYYNGGYVGIGTATPGQELDVVGAVRGSSSAAFGLNASAANTGSSLASGQGATASGQYSIAMGFNANTGAAAHSVAIGRQASVSGDLSVAIGYKTAVSATSSMVLGSGLSANPLSNSIANSIAIGSNSNVPTLLVTGGDGTVGSLGNVGIGTTTPSERLEVNGKVKATELCIGTDCKAAWPTGTGDFKSDGSVAMTGKFRAAPGAWNNPSISFSDSTNSGLFSGGGYIGFSGNGSLLGTWSTNALGLNGSYSAYMPVNAGTTASTPGYGFNGATNTGMYYIAPNGIGFSANGAEAVRITSTGVGIGTTPTEKLEVAGKVKATEFCIGASCLAAWPAGATGTAGGDLTGTYPDPTVAKIRGNAVSAGTIPGADVGKVYRWNGTSLVATFLNFGDLRTSAGAQQLTTICAANQKIQWSVITDAFTCEAIGSLDATTITTGTIDTARLPASANLWQAGASSSAYYTAGAVGVGTSTPSHKLHVSSTTTHNGVGINAPTGFNGYIDFELDGVKKANIVYSAANGFQINNVGSMTVINRSGGNVGIATSTPQAKLDIGGATVVRATGAGDALWSLSNGSTGGQGGLIMTQVPPESAAATNSGYKFYTTGTGTAGTFYLGYISDLTKPDIVTNRMIVTSTGNVGIGSTTPTSTFDVRGTTNVQTSAATAFKVTGVGTTYADSVNGVAFIYSDNTSGAGGNILKAASAFAPNSFVVKDNGYVGMGTNAPAASLDIHANRVNPSGIPIVSVTNDSNAVSGSALTVDIAQGQGITNFVAGAKINAAGTGYEFLGDRAASRISMNDGTISLYTSTVITGTPGQPVTWSGINGGLAAMLIDSAGRFGIGTEGPAYRLHVLQNGTAAVAAFQNATGTCTITPNTSSLSCSSDIRLKKNIESILGLDALNKILNLQAKSYEWKADDGSRHIGYIAQEAEKVVPELVTTDANGYKQISYSGFVPLLSEAIKEVHQENKRDIASINEEKEALKKEVEDLKTKNKALEDRLKKIEAYLSKSK